MKDTVPQIVKFTVNHGSSSVSTSMLFCAVLDVKYNA